MENIKGHLKTSVEYRLRQEASNRVDIGIGVFETTDGVLTGSSKCLEYDEWIAVAALMMREYDNTYAAALVHHDIVWASPFRADLAVEGAADSDQVGGRELGIHRLADGSLWSVHADEDICRMKPDYLSRDYVIVATRAGSIVDEAPKDRVRHLLTRCDELGQYLTSA